MKEGDYIKVKLPNSQFMLEYMEIEMMPTILGKIEGYVCEISPERSVMVRIASPEYLKGRRLHIFYSINDLKRERVKKLSENEFLVEIL